MNNVSPPVRQKRTLARQLSILPRAARVFPNLAHQNGADFCINKLQMVQLCTAAEMCCGFLASRASIFKPLILNALFFLRAALDGERNFLSTFF
ncbi:hypothetical protein IGS61_24535 [Janthinobacterium sp. FW305-129]|uniref:hypothetical protein n=1 Tax=Janthinobacterium sp. FW305-129 TaxID=2775054 RepID=UPI001E4F2542|nr:hypothetical protein [Janthinobacterium sp. FW305-129]MCC7600679.1 hypothetical protein [Janthinobacterium sp. FW305-129]